MIQFTELTKEDLHLVITRIPKDIRKLMIGAKKDVILAGGFIRSTIAGETIADYDLFGPTEGKVKDSVKTFNKERKGRIYKSENAITILSMGRPPVQFITRWTYDDPAEVARSFDFTIAQAVVWHDDTKWHSLIHPEFYSDLAARRLRYTHPQRNEDAGGSILRVRKFLQKGYHIQVLSLAGVIARLVGSVRFEALENVSADLLNDEFGLTDVLCGKLREVDPLTVIDGVELVDETKTIEELTKEVQNEHEENSPSS